MIVVGGVMTTKYWNRRAFHIKNCCKYAIIYRYINIEWTHMKMYTKGSGTRLSLNIVDAPMTTIWLQTENNSNCRIVIIVVQTNFLCWSIPSCVECIYEKLYFNVCLFLFTRLTLKRIVIPFRFQLSPCYKQLVYSLCS